MPMAAACSSSVSRLSTTCWSLIERASVRAILALLGGARKEGERVLGDDQLAYELQQMVELVLLDLDRAPSRAVRRLGGRRVGGRRLGGRRGLGCGLGAGLGGGLGAGAVAPSPASASSRSPRPARSGRASSASAPASTASGVAAVHSDGAQQRVGDRRAAARPRPRAGTARRANGAGRRAAPGRRAAMVASPDRRQAQLHELDLVLDVAQDVVEHRAPGAAVTNSKRSAQAYSSRSASAGHATSRATARCSSDGISRTSPSGSSPRKKQSGCGM